MTRQDALMLIQNVNPALTALPERADAKHLLSLTAAGQVGTTNYDLRTLDDEILRTLVTPKAA